MVSNITHPCPCCKRPCLASLGCEDGPPTSLCFILFSNFWRVIPGIFTLLHTWCLALCISGWTGGITNLFWTSAKLTESNSDCLVIWSTNWSEVCFQRAQLSGIWSSIRLGKLIGLTWLPPVVKEAFVRIFSKGHRRRFYTGFEVWGAGSLYVTSKSTKLEVTIRSPRKARTVEFRQIFIVLCSLDS